VSIDAATGDVPRIRSLGQQLINRIAAGEVIERPASVVKELLENSVDALAGRIELDLVDGGLELIRVVDDGEGILADDLPLAVACHATSKLADPDDLFRVRTLGFRGEALASIAEVSRFRLQSRPAGQEFGAEIIVEGGETRSLGPCGAPRGTVVEVRDLFFNTPVRRRFLRTPSTELGHVCEQFTRIALPQPRLHFVLRHNQKTLFELPGSDRLLDRIRVFHGRETVDQLVPVEGEANGIRLWGYVGQPSLSHSTRKHQYLFVNGRWIQDRSLQHALGEAYRGLLMVGRFPVTYLFLEVPVDQVDVNVHPTKAEVRFRDGHEMYRIVLGTLRSKFLTSTFESGFRLPPSPDAPAGGAAEPSSAARRAALPFKAGPAPPPLVREEFAQWARTQLEQRAAALAAGASPSAEADDGVTPAPFSTPAAAPPRTSSSPPEARENAAPVPPPAHAPAGGPAGQTASGRGDDSRAHPAAPSVVGPLPASLVRPPGCEFRAMQIHDTYLVVETDEGLTVIDQHALHERILYEEFRERVLRGAVESQRLLLPAAVELQPLEAALVLEHASTLERLGFVLEDFGGNTLLLQAYPVMLERSEPAQVLKELAERLVATGRAPTRRDLLDELLETMACKAAIKAGHRLQPEEIDNLLRRRSTVDDAHHCPHGRPTALNLSRHELDRQFGRLGA